MMQTQRDKYLVMLIITDGEIHDMQQSIQQIVNASRLPLSILISTLAVRGSIRKEVPEEPEV